MGRADNPVRQLFNCAASQFLRHFPIIYVLTVVARDGDGRIVTFIGDDIECSPKAAELAFRVNFVVLDSPLRKAVTYLGPGEFRSTWLGNKTIYRTRMALADGAELIILAPGVKGFGEEVTIETGSSCRFIPAVSATTTYIFSESSGAMSERTSPRPLTTSTP